MASVVLGFLLVLVFGAWLYIAHRRHQLRAEGKNSFWLEIAMVSLPGVIIAFMVLMSALH